MKFSSKITRKIILGFTLLLLVFIFGILIFLNSKKPQRDGTLKLPGLKAAVEVKFDQWGIPHIYGNSEEDLYLAMGYIHAQDRLFQMEMIRRLAKGELSEILGKKYIKTDKFFRTLGIKRYSEEYIKELPADNRPLALGKAYIQGVNHFIKNGPTPIEFQMIGIPKRPFTTADSVAIGGYIAYSFASAFKTDTLLTYIRDKYGSEYLEDLAYERPGNHLKKTTATGPDDITLMADIAELVLDIEDFSTPVGLFEGSNAWVISGTKTKSGKPILAGDPHVEFAIPSSWYEALLNCPGFDFYGHFFAGVPMALLGHNRDTGWSITMYKNDDIDFFREKINPDNPDQVWNNGRWQDLLVQKEIIKVKGEKDFIFNTRSTGSRTIINDVVKGMDDQKEPVSMWWAYLEKSNRLFDAFYEFSRARSIQDMHQAAQKIAAPGINVLAADRHGNIAWWALGKVPARPRHSDPNFIMESGRDEYRGFWPFKRQPQALNPPSGIIISTNNKPKFKRGNFVPGYYNIPYRAHRIRELLDRKENGWTAEDMKAIQFDNTTQFHEKIRSVLLSTTASSEEIIKNENALKALNFFKEWKGDHELKSIGPTIFFQFYYDFMEAVFKDELGDNFFKLFRGTKFYEKTIPIIISNPNSPWWDNIKTQKNESRKDILVQSWLKTVETLEKNLGSEVAEWRWEKVHTIEYMHPIGRKKPFNLVFNIGPFKVSGAREVVNNMGFKITGGHHAVTLGPSTRRIIDFADTDHSLGINPLGQSGFFFDKYYDDQAEMFIRGQYRTQLMNKKEIEKDMKSKLVLHP